MIIEQEDYQVTLLRKRVKNLNLRINVAGTVTLSVPLKCPFPIIQAYLQDKQDWIQFHRQRLQSHVLPPALQFKTGETHFFLGKAYELKITEVSLKKRVLLDGTQIHLLIKSNMTAQEKQSLLVSWYHEQFKKLAPDLIKKWEPIIGVKINSWGIKAMKTRWGSCNINQKRVWLNLHLIQKNLGCIEYVLVHEMVHLLEPSHNKRFYAFMTQFMPNWMDYKNQLKNGLIGD